MSYRQPFRMFLSRTSLFLIILLLHTTHADQSQSSNLAKGTELTSEIEQLHLSLSRITSLLASSNIKEDTEIMSKTAKLVRRVRTLIHANNNESNSNNMAEVRKKQQQERNRLLRQKARRIQREKEEERKLRGDGNDVNGEVENIQEEEELMEMTWWTGDGHEMKGDSAVGGGDSVERRLFDTVSICMLFEL